MRDNGRRNTLIGLAAYAVATVVLISFTGVLLARETIFLWLLVGLLVISLTDVRGFARGVIVDWLPFYLILVAYDFLRGFVGAHPFFDPHFLPQIRIDEFLFGGIPTVTLQDKLYEVGRLPWYDVYSWLTYLTHYFAVFIVAAILWRVARPRFLQFRAMVVTLSLSAFLTYAFLPAAPPWMASDYGYIDHPVYRVIGSVWSELGVYPAASIWDKGDSLYNPVAALPSLHAAFPMLLLCFFWRDGKWLRLAGAIYVLSMGWTLVYGGEHYVFDILLGWVYGVAVYFGVLWARRRWAARRRNREPDLAAAEGTA
jgi:membrane-associated phospholipid phosphatase